MAFLSPWPFLFFYPLSPLHPAQGPVCGPCQLQESTKAPASQKSVIRRNGVTMFFFYQFEGLV